MEAVLVDFGAAYPASGSGSALFVAQATTIQMVHNSTLFPLSLSCPCTGNITLEKRGVRVEGSTGRERRCQKNRKFLKQHHSAIDLKSDTTITITHREGN